MLFSLSRILTVALHMSGPFWPAKISPIAHPHFFKTRVPKVSKQYAMPTKVAKSEPADFISLHLNSNLIEFNMIFAGQVHCGTQPCPADLDLTVNTTRNQDLHRVIHTMDDGNFILQLPVTEGMHEPADWRISATNPAGRIAEAHGRNLLEDSVISIDVSLNVH